MSSQAVGRGGEPREPLGLVGRDVAGGQRPRRAPLRGRQLAVAVGAAVLVGLAVAALRSDLLRMRYALSEAMQREREFLQERRELVARVRALRDPARLARLARERGFTKPERVYELERPGGLAR
jgi:hypothetical protein